MKVTIETADDFAGLLESVSGRLRRLMNLIVDHGVQAVEEGEGHGAVSCRWNNGDFVIKVGNVENAEVAA